MISKTTKQILEESKALRFGFKKPDAVAEIGPQLWLKLPWHYHYLQVLGPEGLFQFGGSIFNLYNDEGPVGNIEWPESVTVIVHGHSRTKFCVTKTLCHLLGYKPNSLPVGLQKRWEELFD